MAEAERTVGDLLARLGYDDEAGAVKALAAVATSERDAMPWYVEVVLGIGAWLAGLMLGGSVVALLVITLGIDEPFGPLLLLGAVAVALGVAIRRHSGGRLFARQLALSWSVGGQALIAAGVLGETGSAGLAAVVQVLLAGALLALLRDGLHQFIAATLACGLAAYALVEASPGQAAGVLALVTVPPALLLLLRPTRPLDTRGTAYALLLAGSIAAGFLGGPLAGVEVESHGLARAVYVGALGVLLWLLREESDLVRRPAVFAAAVAAALLAALLSIGIVASLLLLPLAYLLGSRALAVVGTLGVVWFMGVYYYELEMTLLAKSGLLAAAGAAFLALGWALGRAAAARRRSAAG